MIRITREFEKSARELYFNTSQDKLCNFENVFVMCPEMTGILQYWSNLS